MGLTIFTVSARLTGMVDQLKEVDYTSERRVPVARGFFCATDYMQSRLASLEYALGSFDSSLHPSFLGTARMIRKSWFMSLLSHSHCMVRFRRETDTSDDSATR